MEITKYHKQTQTYRHYIVLRPEWGLQIGLKILSSNEQPVMDIGLG